MKFVYPLLAVLLAVFAIAPLDYPGAFQSHTGLLAYYNLIDLAQRPLQFFNWTPTVGASFDLFRTDGALPYLVALIFHSLGFDALAAIKLVYALAWVASGWAMFAFARKFMSEPGALLASVVYTYLPFHIATVYVRGAFAESVMWAWMPLALLVVSRQSPVDSRQTFAFSTLVFALLFLTQPGIAILFALVAIAFHFAQVGTLAHWRIGTLPILAGLVLGALVDLPTILRHGAHVARDGFNANFVFPFQLFSATWGFGISTGSFLDQFPFQLGIAALGLAIVAIALAWQSNTLLRRMIFVFLGMTIVVCLLTFEITAPLWKILGIFVAYPWQVLTFAGLALALVAGSALEFDARLTKPAMLAFFVALPVVASYSYLAPKFLDAKPVRPVIATFNDNEVALLDYRIVGPLRHGATLRVYLTWQALQPIYTDYNVFVHAIHANGETYGQSDNKPQDGTSPMIKWMPGQVVTDMHLVQINVDGPDEGYHLELGIYKPATGERALTSIGTDQISVPRPGDPEPVISENLPPNK